MTTFTGTETSPPAPAKATVASCTPSGTLSQSISTRTRVWSVNAPASALSRTHGTLTAARQATVEKPVLKRSTKRTSRVYDENLSGFSAPFALPSAATPNPAVSAAGTVTTLGRPGALGICDG